METKIFLANFERKKKAIGLIHRVYLTQIKNARKYNASTKTKSEVRGGGRKPWKQKGTGRARQGSIRSPQWKGGGVVFAPKSRDFSFKLNKKVKKLALKCVLSSKLQESKIIVIDELKFEAVKTKSMVKVLSNLNLNKALFILDGENKNVVLSSRNIQGIKTAGVNEINVYDILKFDALVLTKSSVNKIQEVYA